MRKLALLLTVISIMGVAPAAYANHTPALLSDPIGLPLEGAPIIEVGNWDFIGNFPAGPAEVRPLGVDVEMFSKTLDDGVHKYVIMSSTILGFSIFDVTDPEAPIRVGDYGAAVCGAEAQIQQLIDILANGQDFNAGSTALGLTHGWEGDIQITPDGNIAILATDAAGRCHDPSWGGLEIVDISDPAAPSLLGLTRMAGESHNVTIDPERPWIAYNSNSDTSANNFMDIVDFSSCLDLDPTTCLPEVARYQFDDALTSTEISPPPSACHDITYAMHKLFGACINSTIVWDPSNVYVNGELTGSHLTDPADVGEENACTLEAPSAEALVEVQVVDCHDWSVEKGRELGIENVDLDVKIVIKHAGVGLDEDAQRRQEIQISHKADPMSDGKLIAVNDERGGGLNAPPGTCPGGGIWFFDVRDPKHPVAAQPRKGKGKKAIFFPRADHQVPSPGANCTSHLFWEWPGVRHLVAAGWYSSGTQVFKYCANFDSKPATVEFYNRKALVLPGSSTWTSRIIDQVNNDDGTRTLYFAATDITRGFDFFKLTLGEKNKKPWKCKPGATSSATATRAGS